MLSPHTLLPCLLRSLPSSLAFPLRHPSFPAAQVSSPIWSRLAGTTVEVSRWRGWGSRGLGSPPTQKQHPAHGARGSGRPSRQRGLETPELLPGTGRQPQASLRSPAPLPGAGRSAPKEGLLAAPQESAKAGLEPGQSQPSCSRRASSPSKEDALLWYPMLTRGEPRAQAGPASEGSQHEAGPPGEAGSSTRPQSPLRGLS